MNKLINFKLVNLIDTNSLKQQADEISESISIFFTVIHKRSFTKSIKKQTQHYNNPCR